MDGVEGFEPSLWWSKHRVLPIGRYASISNRNSIMVPRAGLEPAKESLLKRQAVPFAMISPRLRVRMTGIEPVKARFLKPPAVPILLYAHIHISNTEYFTSYHSGSGGIRTHNDFRLLDLSQISLPI